MFIAAKRNYLARRADGSLYGIKKGFVGEIPEDVAGSALVRRAIKSGKIAVPEGAKDRELREADKAAGEKAAGDDIRPDAKGKGQAPENRPMDGKKAKPEK